MSPDEAVQRLDFHTQPEPGSFLEMLRPYRGLRDDILEDVSRSLRACAPLFGEDRVPRNLLSSVWTISFLGRLWALEPDGMLRRNGLIDKYDLKRLGTFLEHLDWAVFKLLEKLPDPFADWPADLPPDI